MFTELPEGMPGHGLGVGEPEDILQGSAHGVDTFDCVTPTRNGRTGGIYSSKGKYQLPNAVYQYDFGPLEEGGQCPVCFNPESGKPAHTRAYVRHLFMTKEMLGPVLASMHNLYFLNKLCADIRESILNGTFEHFRDTFLSSYGSIQN